MILKIDRDYVEWRSPEADWLHAFFGGDERTASDSRCCPTAARLPGLPGGRGATLPQPQAQPAPPR